MRIKHNKKRNTAFLFEALTNELTKAIVSEDKEKKALVLKVIKESFHPRSTLKKELSIYDSIVKAHDLSARQAEKVYLEAVKQYSSLNREQIFSEQSKLINQMNKTLSSEVFDNFVPSYTLLATAHQLFNSELPPKSKIMLEERLLSSMIKKPILEGSNYTLKKVPTDKLVVKTHFKKFNEKFGAELLKEQKTLLQKYINSFSDNGLELKIYLNEELSRLKTFFIEQQESREDLGKVVDVIDGFKGQFITREVLDKTLKLQSLAKELEDESSN